MGFLGILIIGGALIALGPIGWIIIGIWLIFVYIGNKEDDISTQTLIKTSEPILINKKELIDKFVLNTIYITSNEIFILANLTEQEKLYLEQELYNIYEAYIKNNTSQLNLNNIRVMQMNTILESLFSLIEKYEKDGEYYEIYKDTIRTKAQDIADRIDELLIREDLSDRRIAERFIQLFYKEIKMVDNFIHKNSEPKKITDKEAIEMLSKELEKDSVSDFEDEVLDSFIVERKIDKQG